MLHLAAVLVILVGGCIWLRHLLKGLLTSFNSIIRVFLLISHTYIKNNYHNNTVHYFSKQLSTSTNVPKTDPGTITSQPSEPSVLLTAFRRRVHSFETWKITLKIYSRNVRKKHTRYVNCNENHKCRNKHDKKSQILLDSIHYHTQHESQLLYMCWHCFQGFLELFLASATFKANLLISRSRYMHNMKRNLVSGTKQY